MISRGGACHEQRAVHPVQHVGRARSARPSSRAARGPRAGRRRRRGPPCAARRSARSSPTRSRPRPARPSPRARPRPPGEHGGSASKAGCVVSRTLLHPAAEQVVQAASTVPSPRRGGRRRRSGPGPPGLQPVREGEPVAGREPQRPGGGPAAAPPRPRRRCGGGAGRRRAAAGCGPVPRSTSGPGRPTGSRAAGASGAARTVRSGAGSVRSPVTRRTSSGAAAYGGVGGDPLGGGTSALTISAVSAAVRGSASA